MLFALKGCGSRLGLSLKKSCILLDLWNHATDIFIESVIPGMDGSLLGLSPLFVL